MAKIPTICQEQNQEVKRHRRTNDRATLTNLGGFIALALARDRSQIEGNEDNEDDVARVGATLVS